MIPRAIIDEIIFRNDIEQVIGSYVSLKRAGSNLQGLCPFHSERSPSFTVFSATKSFFCFGCGAGGDVITFIMKEENLDYVDAVKFLGARAGIPVEDDREEENTDTVSRKRVYEMNLAAARFFRDRLFDPQYGKEGLEYLTKTRGLSLATIKAFGLGFAPDHFWLLHDHMRKQGFTDEELIAGFLCKRSEKTGKLFDLFRNRIIFPVIDTLGNVIAFGGRVMDDSKPKYLNSSDTPAFKKTRNLFALNFAKKHAAERIILCEGYMDVIALHAAGISNAVATLGTAITSDQARILAKYTKQVVICYDSDAAGQAADHRAIRLLSEVGVDVRILKVNGAKDPDEYIKRFGVESFQKLLGTTKTSFDYKMESVLAQYDVSQSDGKIKAASELCLLIAEISSAVERDIYIRRVTSVLETSSVAMERDVAQIRRARAKNVRKQELTDAKISVTNATDRVNPDASRYLHANSAEETLLGLMLIYEEFRHDAAIGSAGIRPEDFSTAFGKRVFEAVIELENSEEGYSQSMLGMRFTVDEMGRIEKMIQNRRKLSKNDREVFLDAILTIQKEKRAQQSSSDPFWDLKEKREAYQKIKNAKNT